MSLLSKVTMSEGEFDLALVRVKFFSYSTYSNGFQHVQPLAVRKVREMSIKFISIICFLLLLFI